MSALACSLLPGRDVRSYHLRDRLPLEYPQYALRGSANKRVAYVSSNDEKVAESLAVISAETTRHM
jgi:hypothetical protein